MKNFILLIFLCASLFSIAQEHPHWVNYTSTRSVKKVIQDKNILWIATKGGLIKHDLRTKTNQYFNRGNSSIPGNDINDILLDQNYDLWVATNDGVARYDGDNWINYLEEIGSFNAYVLTLNMFDQVVVAGNYSLHTLVDGEFIRHPSNDLQYLYPTDIVTNPVDSSIWVTSYTYGQFNICRYQGTNVQCFDQTNSILPMESPRMNALIVDQHGTIWTDSGFYKELNREWQLYVPTDNMNLGNSHSLAIGEDHHLWFLSSSGQGQGQLIELDETYQVIRRIDLPEEIDFHYYQQYLYLSPNSNYDIYVSSAFDGLWRFRNDTWEQMDIHADFEIGNRIEQIFLANEDAWVKSNHHNQIDSELKIRNNSNNEWSIFDNSLLPDSLQSINRSGIVNQLSDNSLQFFVNDHVWFYLNGNWIDANLPDVSPLLDENRSIIHFDPNGRRWVLDKWSGFVLYESPSGWKVFAASEHGNSSGNSNGHFNHPITEEFWIAGNSGISIYDGQAWRQFKPSEQSDLIYKDRILDIAVTDNGVVWIVQQDHLLRLEGNDMRIIHEINGKSLRSSLHSIELDAEEDIWLGMNNALGHFKEDTWTIYDTKNSGVISDRIHQLKIDAGGNVWMGGYNAGLGIFNPNGLSESFFVNKSATSNPENEVPAFSIFPNPHTKGARLCINLPEAFSTNDTTVGTWYTALGQKLGVFTTKERLTILSESHFSGWSTGVYYLKLENNGNEISQGVLLNQ